MCKKGQEWSPAQLRLLKDHYPNKKTIEVATLIGKTAYAVHGQAYKLGLKKSTEFKKSAESGRWFNQPIGSEYIDKDGYLLRKVSNSSVPQESWRYVHILIWETHHGPVPKGYIVAFKNGDRRITDISNLELITRKECLARFTIHRYPDEVKQLIRLHRKLERTIKEGMKDA